VLYLICPTGGRPEGLALLNKHLNEQTYQGPAKWIIVDDCDPASPIPESRFDVTYLRPPRRWQPGMNTQAESMAMALGGVPDDAVVAIVEDDDCYLPGHLENVLTALESADLVGEKTARYYNVANRRYKEMGGGNHAALASTACRGEALALLKKICRAGSKRIDIDLWRQFNGQKKLLPTTNVVGIKGLPGRQGIGVGHRQNFGTPDTTGVLRQWIGDRADAYEHD